MSVHTRRLEAGGVNDLLPVLLLILPLDTLRVLVDVSVWEGEGIDYRAVRRRQQGNQSGGCYSSKPL